METKKPKKISTIFLTSIPDGLIKRLQASDGSSPIQSWITPVRAGKFFDPRYEWFDITLENLQQMETNFKANVVGLMLPVNFAHAYDSPAVAWHKDLRVEGSRLRALVEWTPTGIAAIKNNEFKYLSAEYDENYQDNETGTNQGCVYLGAALTNNPVIRNQDPVSLSRQRDPESEIRVVLHPKLEKELSENNMEEKEQMKKLLQRFLSVSGLPEEVVKKLAAELEPKITEQMKDDEIVKLAQEAISAARKELATPPPPPSPQDAPAAKDDPPPAPKHLSQDDFNAMYLAKRAEEEKQTKALADKRTAQISAFEKKLSEQKGLPDETRKQLAADFTEFVSADLPDHVAIRYGERILKLSEQSIAAAKLAQEGFVVHGKVIVTDAQEQKRALAVCEHLDENVLRLSKKSAAIRYPNCRELTPIAKEFSEKALSLFDRVYARQLHQEGQRFLAGGPTGIGDTTIGTSLFSVARTVIREALSDLIFLNLVDGDIISDKMDAATVYIPYVYRDRESNLLSSLQKYQGQAIGRAQVKQSGENAYVSPLKLMTAIYDEVLVFGQNLGFNYRPLEDNLAECTRIIKEAIEELILTEMTQACDEFGAVAVTNENLTAQCDGANSTFQLGLVGGVLTKFPLVKPRKIYDLTGAQIGSTVHPITMTYDGTLRTEYDGTNTQGAGIYWKVTDWVLGQFQLVSELGVLVVPANGKTLVVNSYSYSTNRTLFDFYFDAGVSDWKEHLNLLLDAHGRAIAAMSQDRYFNADFIAMSKTLNQYASEARLWSPMNRIEGLTMDQRGNAASVKGLPTFSSNAPITYFGQKRSLISLRGTTKYRITKPWAFETDLVPLVDSNGKFLGEKGTYGTQFHCIHTPGGYNGGYKGRSTQIIAYDSRTVANGGDVGPF